MTMPVPHSLNTSRPKIHRLPTLPAEPRERRLLATVLNYGDTARLIFTLSSVALAVLLVAIVATRFFPVPLKQNIVASANAEASVLPPSQKTIVLRNENDVIVGQMARISSPSLPSPEVSTMSNDVDKRKGQELLSIIGKY
jgi:hypothetical protein